MLKLVVPVTRDAWIENAVSVLFSFSASERGEKRRHFSFEPDETCGDVHNVLIRGLSCHAASSRGESQIQPHVATGSAVAHFR